MGPPPGRLSLTQRINLIRTLPGRLFVLSGGLLLLLWGIRQATELPLIVDLFRKVVSLAFIASGVWLVALLVLRNRTRVLWRVRRKLILSYVLLGFVPVVLIAVFALSGGVVLYENVTAYLFHEGFDDVVDEVHQVADTAAVELSRVHEERRTSSTASTQTCSRVIRICRLPSCR